MRLKVLVLTTGIDKGRLAVLEAVAESEAVHITLCRSTRWWWPKDYVQRVSLIESLRWGANLPFWLFNDDVYVHLDPLIVARVAAKEWDVVLLYGYASFTALFVALAARARSIPVILWSDARVDYELTRAHWVRWFKTRLHGLASGFLASGTAAQRFLEITGAPPARISVAPYSVDNEQILCQSVRWKEAASITRRGLGIPEAAPVLLYVGRMVKPKGVEDLLRAAQRLQAAGCAFHLVLVGDGPDREHFEASAAAAQMHSVHFTGRVDPDSVGKYYAIASWFILPSHRDVWAKVVNEALLYGVPVITTRDVGAHYDLVIEGVTGYTYPTHDVEALTTRLTQVLQEPGLSNRLSANTFAVIGPWSISTAAKAVRYRLTQTLNESLSNAASGTPAG
jgi:glycosyltransferase involved in cell wall biosynthesis